MKKPYDRRSFIKTAGGIAGLAAGTSLVPTGSVAAQEEVVDAVQEETTGKSAADQEEKLPETTTVAAAPFIPNRIAISTYSFWRYRDDSKFNIPHCIDLAAQMGFDCRRNSTSPNGRRLAGVLTTIEATSFLKWTWPLRHVHPPRFCNARCGRAKKERPRNYRLYRDGLCTRYSHDPSEHRSLANDKKLDELMEAKGVEPILDGYTDDDGFKWVVDCLTECLPTAEKCGVVLGLENHWGLGRTAEGVLKIINAVDSPWLKATMDTGNFFDRRKEQLEMMAPETAFVQAKTYFGGGTWYELDIDYDHVAKTLQAAKYRGYVSLEFEGKEDYKTAIPRSLQVLREAFGKRHDQEPDGEG